MNDGYQSRSQKNCKEPENFRQNSREKQHENTQVKKIHSHRVL